MVAGLILLFFGQFHDVARSCGCATAAPAGPPKYLLDCRTQRLSAVDDGATPGITEFWGAGAAPAAPAGRDRALAAPAIVAVLNLQGGCGKSTIAVNLARALAANGERVLLTDNLRNAPEYEGTPKLGSLY